MTTRRLVPLLAVALMGLGGAAMAQPKPGQLGRQPAPTVVVEARNGFDYAFPDVGCVYVVIDEAHSYLDEAESAYLVHVFAKSAKSGWLEYGGPVLVGGCPDLAGAAAGDGYALGERQPREP